MAHPHVPQRWIDGVVAEHRRIEATLDALGDDDARRPSALPDWTVAHVATHIARNADSQTTMVTAAHEGRVSAQYPGGIDQRNGDIAAGAERSLVEVRADLAGAHARLEQAWADTDDATWSTGYGVGFGGPLSLADWVFLRWREAAIHAIDLGLGDVGGPTWADLHPTYVDTEWERTVLRLPERLPDGVLVVLVPDDRPSRAVGAGERPTVVRGATTDLLAWLTGRAAATDDRPTLGPWR